MWLVREWLAWFSPRRWRYSWRQAAHVVRVTEAEARGQDFYGSMCLDDERGLPANWAAPSSKIAAHAYSTAWLPAPEVAHSGWWRQTAADLAPEALDENVIDLGYLSLPAELQWELESSGPGVKESSSTESPGPDLGRLAWLDRQLDAHAVWARRMRGQVTGWGLEAAAA